MKGTYVRELKEFTYALAFISIWFLIWWIPSRERYFFMIQKLRVVTSQKNTWNNSITFLVTSVTFILTFKVKLSSQQLVYRFFSHLFRCGKYLHTKISLLTVREKITNALWFTSLSLISVIVRQLAFLLFLLLLLNLENIFRWYF